MKQLHEIKKKLPLLLLFGILMLCLGFVLINCGKGPLSKIINSDAGQFAIDFGDTSNGASSAVFFVTEELLKRQGTEVTVEAWVKRKTAALNGAVFSRHNAEGVFMWINDNEPKFAIRLVSGTSTDFVVESNVSLSANTWYHLAGVLANAAHSHPSSTSCSPTVMAETPHLDIYVDGEFKNCATTGSRSMADLTCTAATLGGGTCEGDTLGVGVLIGSASSDGMGNTFNSIIDEVRYWTAERTETQIQACMNQELISHNSGDCGVNNSNLAGYMRFNEGKGSAPSDWTGLGSGSKESPSGTIGWEGGWVSGAPITRKD